MFAKENVAVRAGNRRQWHLSDMVRKSLSCPTGALRANGALIGFLFCMSAIENDVVGECQYKCHS